MEAFDFSTIHLLHEHLCLDFVNSSSNHRNRGGDYLKLYADLVSWGLDVGLLNADEAAGLWAMAIQQPAKADALHQQAVVLREAIYRILRAIAHNEPPPAADFDTLNAALREAMAHMRLTPGEIGAGWVWDDAEDAAYLLWRAAWAGGELLRSEVVQHVRQCEGCDWLFLDVGRGHKRRWCDMKTCGNRAKAKRHYQRSRGEEE